MGDARFVTDYAKSSRSTCRKCNEKIEKGILRLAMMVQSTVRDGKDPHWHHFDCFFAKPRGISSTAMLKGFGGLRPDDQHRVTEGIEGKTASKGTKRKSTAENSPKNKKAKAASTEKSSSEAEAAAPNAPFAAQSKAFWTIKDELDAHASLAELKSMLKRNRIHTKGGERKDTLVPRVAKLIQFGVPPKCSACESPWRLRFNEDSGLWYCGFRLEYSRCPYTIPPQELATEPFSLPKPKKKKKKTTKKKQPQQKKKSAAATTTTKAVKNKVSTKKAPAHANSARQKASEPTTGTSTRVTRRFTRLTRSALRALAEKDDEEEEEKKQEQEENDGGDENADTNVNAAEDDENEDADDMEIDQQGQEEEEEEEEKEVVGTPFEQSIARLGKEFAEPRKPVGKSEGAPAEAASTEPAKIFSGYIFSHARPAKELAKSELGDVRKLIEDNGGTWSARVTSQVHFLIEDPKKYSAKASKVKTALKHDVHVVRESFIKQSISNKTLLDSGKFRLDAKRPSGNHPDQDDDEIDAEEEEKEVVPEGARVAVHKSARKALGDAARVLDLGGDNVYHAVLSKADIEKNQNSFYKIQVVSLHHAYHVSCEYGRTGTNIRNNKLTPCRSGVEAKNEFERIFLDKTGNEWKNHRHFEKQAGKFEFIETRLLDATEVARALAAKNPSAASKHIAECKLHSRVVDLVELIFDKKLMESAMMEMEIDLQKFPLGALTTQHVDKGYKTLSEIADVLGETSPRDAAHRKQQLLALSNKFFHLIPSQSISLIDSDEMVKKKVELVDALRDMEVAARFLSDEDAAARSTRSEAEEKYDKLKTRLDPLEVDGVDWKRLDEWVQNTSRSSLGGFGASRGGLKLVDAYAVDREGEEARFGKSSGLDNHKLLWHGSRTTNYCGILSQGLRIAPPEAPRSGYRFGKGVYFADLISKSAAYCRTAGSSDMLIMACEVALGTEYEAYRDEYMEKPRPGTNSTHAMGSRVPDPKCDLVTGDGITIPSGPPINSGVRSSCSANEFIVYDISQIRIRYLLRLSTDSSKSAPAKGPVVLPTGEDVTPKPALV
ncbi:Poly ADP-ribose polymerase [Hondaea fermentalgiana]|uniref:Poly [ADP-ribose] polymerase n=1 Tax=Hondaea fermentalgiana TaxID=2315210 RepID=A0A2R5G271_9STRA|nr:Poly ADP-ribose polymerase [Hondaea fermentalgiana]|eukprot:GBG24635.1 Poly ADP-ribose polymerase [Hondaea fermentalgiana]